MFKIIAETIRKIRKKSGHTQHYMANLLGIDRSTYSYYELGKIMPDVKTVMKLSKIFDVHYTQILDSENLTLLADGINEVEFENFKKDKKNTAIPTSDNLSEKEKDFLIAFRLLCEPYQDDIMKEMSDKFKIQRKSKDSKK